MSSASSIPYWIAGKRLSKTRRTCFRCSRRPGWWIPEARDFLTIFRGFKMAIDGEEIDDSFLAEDASAAEEDNLTLDDVNDIKFGYCTEFFVIHLVESFTEADLDKFRGKAH